LILDVLHMLIHGLQVIFHWDAPHFRAQFIEDGNDLPNLFKFLIEVRSDLATRKSIDKHLVYLALLKTKLTGD